MAGREISARTGPPGARHAGQGKHRPPAQLLPVGGSRGALDRCRCLVRLCAGGTRRNVCTAREALPGRAINKKPVLHRLASLAGQYEMQEIAYDRWRIEDFQALISEEGISLPPLVPFGQGFKDMAPAVDEFERLLLGRDMRHDNNPVLTWCAANAVVMTDPAGNRKIAKERAIGRVD